MAVFQLGPIIRNRRMELGFSQEDLADGICSVPTLSRIENGERMPTKNHFEMLMQRLGYSAMSLDYFTEKKEFMIYELKFKIRQAYFSREYLLTQTLLAEYSMLISKDSNIDQQFFILYHSLLHLSEYSNEEQLKLFEDTLRLTCPAYDHNRIPHMLSYEEIILLNNIAACHDTPETRHLAISILRTLKVYYESHVVNSEEALKTQPMVLYNLSKMLGLAGKYNECIEICDQALNLAKKTARCTYLGEILYNRAWALIKRNQPGDLSAAAKSALLARSFVQFMEEYEILNQIDTFIRNNHLDTL